MHKITVFPLGNADSTRIDLEGGEKLLFDYADMRDATDNSDKRIDLPKELRSDLEAADRNNYDVVAFTHLDEDHIKGASDFFHFEYAKAYQGDDRIKMDMLWVPAAAILENSINGNARVIRQEARHRLLENKNIRVFSSPGKLDEWLQNEGVDPESRRHLFIDAGQLVPDFDLTGNGFEVFVHTPHAMRSHDGKLLNRNDDAIAVQTTFLKGSQKTRVHFFSDLTHEVITEVVRITEYHERKDRLKWDIFHLPHHCSYKSLSEEKGHDQTEPEPRVKKLYEEYGSYRARLISTSDPVPSTDTEQPPHRQAASYYKSVARLHSGEFTVTMEHPSRGNPKPIVIEIDEHGPTMKKAITPGPVGIGSSVTPRAGR
jgi:hypothetical protein